MLFFSINIISELGGNRTEDMLAGTYMTGTGYSTVKTILNMPRQETESRSTFFRHQAVCEEKLMNCAEQLTQKARDHFSGNVSMDCRWSSPVRGIHGVVSAVDTETLEVLEFAILTKKGRNRPTGNYEDASNKMEIVEKV